MVDKRGRQGGGSQVRRHDTEVLPGDRKIWSISMSEVFFEILTPMPLNSQGEARKLFDVWAQHAPGFFPDRTVVDEPLSEPFSLDFLDEALRNWEFMFSLERVAA